MSELPHTIVNALREKLVAGFNAIPFNQMLGLHLDKLEPEQVSMKFFMKPELIGNFLQGILHGGVISSVLDMAGGMAVMAAVMDKNKHHSVEKLAELLSKTSTVDLQVSYLRPGKGEHFLTQAWIVKAGNKVSFTRMELLNQNQDLIAMASGTYLVS